MSDMITTEVTPEEMTVLLNMRADAERLANHKRRRLTVMRLAADYERWLQENKTGSTYTTFVDDFGVNDQTFDGPRLYEAVQKIRMIAAESVK